jgi:His-Xaa-Ser system radical SAM maturase HxsB
MNEALDHLTPIRFERASDGSIIVTSLAGEWALLSADQFDSLIENRVNDPSLRRELIQKQILTSGNPKFDRQLLATKLAYRYRGLPTMCGLHIFVVTLRCEHSCHYCQVSRRSSSKIEFDMPLDVADKAIDRVFESTSQNVKIEFQGGEPLLNLPLIEYVVTTASERAKRLNRQIDFVIASNLALLDDAAIDLARTYGIAFSTSIDGPPAIHNKARPRPGNDSFERAARGIQRIQSELGKDRVSAIMTTSINNFMSAREVIDTYCDLGLREVFLRQMSPFGFAARRRQFQKTRGKGWIDFYVDGLEYVIEINRRGIEMAELTAAAYLRKMLRNDIGGYVDLMSPTGAGLATLVYNYDGNVYMSDEGRMLKEMGDTTFCLGDVRENSFDQLLSKQQCIDSVADSFSWSATSCSTCALEPFCGSDPVYHQATQGSFAGYKPISDFCLRTKSIVPELMRLYKQDEFTQLLFEKWADL